jgi:carbon monoxide dehydrogenase subunit G
MKIEKTFTVARPQQQVWDFITAPEKVAPCIPGCEGAEKTAANKYKAVITTSVGPIKATFRVDIEATEERPPEYAAYVTSGEEGSKASRIKATSTLKLRRLTDNETEVTYASDINIMGRLGKFGSGMMKKVADAIGDEFVAKMRAQLEAEGGGADTTLQAPPATAGGRARTNYRWLIAAIIILTVIAWLALT